MLGSSMENQMNNLKRLKPSRIIRSIDLTDINNRTRLRSSTEEEEEELRYPFSFNLKAHHGCVNAICFSKHDNGRYLASGGDDMNIILWDFFDDVHKISPIAKFDGPDANIFSIDFSIDGKRLFGTGMDSRVFVYDLEKSARSNQEKRTCSNSSVGKPAQIFNQHTESCRRVACHPHEPNSVLTAAEDSRVIHHDLRASDSSNHITLLKAKQEYTDTTWNPVSSNLFIASTNHTLKLYDRRQLGSNPETNWTKALLSYTTNLIKTKPAVRTAHPDISSITFDRSGRLIGSMMSKWFPTIWSLEDPNPLIVLKSEVIGRKCFDSKQNSKVKAKNDEFKIDGDDESNSEFDGSERTSSCEEESFKDACTIKHGSFSNDVHSNSVYFAAGSDDFRCYGWKLPSIPDMIDKRQIITKSSKWMNELTDTCAAYGKDFVTIPSMNSKPSFKLYGHRSIPNSIIFHESLPIIVTSGVEKILKVHSKLQIGYYPHQTNLSRSKLTPKKVRKKMNVRERVPFVIHSINSSNYSDSNGGGNNSRFFFGDSDGFEVGFRGIGFDMSNFFRTTIYNTNNNDRLISNRNDRDGDGANDDGDDDDDPVNLNEGGMDVDEECGEDMETLAMFDALIERDHDSSHNSLWRETDTEDDDDQEDEDEESED